MGLVLLAIRGDTYASSAIARSYFSRLVTWAAIPFLLVGVWWACPVKKFPEWLTKSAFPVYVMHMMLFSAFGLKILGIRDGLQSFHAFGYVIFALLDYAACVCLSVLMHKYASRTTRLLFGGR